MLPRFERPGERQRRHAEGRADAKEQPASVAQQTGPDAPHHRNSMPGPLPSPSPFAPLGLDGHTARRYALHVSMAQLVFIVSRHRPKLRDYLQREFAGNAEVTVIVDRRLGERRLDRESRSPDWRHAGRRQAQIDERLRSMGWAIVWREHVTPVCGPGGEGAAGPGA